MSFSEFEFISHLSTFQSQLSQPNILGIGDDSALIPIDDTFSYALCTDTSVLGRHYDSKTPVRSVGYKSLAVNLSDLAAMGAEPRYFLLNVTRPSLDKNWVNQFLEGVFDLANQYALQCVGGDTTEGPESIAITTIGTVPTQTALTRSGARVGDLVCVSGELGLAAHALAYPNSTSFTDALHYPKPQIELGNLLIQHASAAIDISDGIISDLQHILTASQVGAEIQIDSLPGFERLKSYCDDDEALKYVLSGGEDYQLCFTVAPDELAIIQSQYQVTSIGRIISGSDIHFYDKDQNPLDINYSGYHHFKDK